MRGNRNKSSISFCTFCKTDIGILEILSSQTRTLQQYNKSLRPSRFGHILLPLQEVTPPSSIHTRGLCKQLRRTQAQVTSRGSLAVSISCLIHEHCTSFAARTERIIIVVNASCFLYKRAKRKPKVLSCQQSSVVNLLQQEKDSTSSSTRESSSRRPQARNQPTNWKNGLSFLAPSLVIEKER